MHYLVQHVLEKYQEQLLTNELFSGKTSKHPTLVVGLSGGVDSVVLLHILTQIRLGKTNLGAIHINHGLSPNANLWQQFCCQYCESLNIDLQIAQHTVTKGGGESLENNARKIRYNEFSKTNAQIIALAHQKDDQIETTLSQVLRGSDLHNIGAMRELSQKHNKYIWRPLLNISRTQIEDYAAQHQLNHIEDESNTDISYLRNFIRHNILPELTKFDKNIRNKILKLPSQVQNTLDVIDSIAASDLANACALVDGVQVIMVEQFRQLDGLRQHNLLTHYLKKHSMPLPTYAQTKEFIRQALSAGLDKHPSLQLDKTHRLIKSKHQIQYI